MKTKTLVLYALFAAIILVLSMTPLGYLKIGLVEISFMMIPIAVGATVMGPTAGAVFGAIFGLTSLWQAVSGASPFFTPLVALNPFYMFIICVVSRILAGWLSGLAAKAFKEKGVLSSLAGSIVAPIMNTVFFVGSLLLLFGTSDYLMSQRGNSSILAFAASLVTINGVIEAVASVVISMPISVALRKAIK